MGRSLQQCPNENSFQLLGDAKENAESSLRHSNEERPRCALMDLSPLEFAALAERVDRLACSLITGRAEMRGCWDGLN